MWDVRSKLVSWQACMLTGQQVHEILEYWSDGVMSNHIPVGPLTGLPVVT